MHKTRDHSLVDAVTLRLRKEIIDGTFQFGEALSETRIAKRYDVSRTPVREAFARLEQEGLVHTEAQVGTFIFTMDEAQFAKLSEVRSILEVAALTDTLSQHKIELVDDWRKLIDQMEQAIATENPRAYSDADGEFHDALFLYAANPYLSDARRTFLAKMTAVRTRLSTTPDHMRKSLSDHKKLLSLAKAGKLSDAVDLLDKHIRNKGAKFWLANKNTPRPRTRRERIESLIDAER